ncbi:MAG: 4-hydroxy-3-methylbut-2-enyl diphosphate reductase [Erysipelotrichaceae bacterium]|nr:4-hydroxy-3-methylbut-2-enyl diphosphate reductase [Erysipelotrichaceae bacterium]
MEIIKVAPRGYCKGVVRAIQIAKEAAKQYPQEPIYVLGMLVHNRYVIEALKQFHIHTIDDKSKTREELLDQIPSGVVIFTAHGISQQAIEKAEKKGLKWIDASCPDVVKTQDIIKEKLQEGYEILYIGKKFHPEAEAICSLSSRIHLIENIQDIPSSLQTSKLFVTNQTTMSMFDVEHLFQAIQTQYPHVLLCEEICNATRVRQEAIAQLKGQEIDTLFVVGDPHSNNSNRLAQIGKEQGIQNVYLIDDVTQIKSSYLIDAKKVAVTSGASTPTYLTNQVIQYLEHYETDQQFPTICINNIL